MPTPIKKITHYKNADQTFAHNVYELDNEVLMPYAAGDFQSLVPKEAKLSNDSQLFCDQPLFNNAGFCSIIENIGQKGALYLELQPGKKLLEIHVEPDSLMEDILVNNNGGLIYQFYNASTLDTVAVKAKIVDDKENLYSKIKSHSNDLEYRQYYLKQALKKPGVSATPQPKVEYPDLMTAEQVAEYLQISLQTVYNKTSPGELKSYMVAGLRRYKKSDFGK